MTLLNFVDHGISASAISTIWWRTCHVRVSATGQTADGGCQGGYMTRGVRITDWSVRGCRWST